jgi:plasmid maintenance system antidote protein VapI
MQSSQPAGRRLRARRETLRLQARTEAEVAALLDMEKAAFSRLVNHKTQPSTPVIVKVLDSFGGRFEDWFEIVDEVAA